jgi:hypothetical protein
MTKFLVIEHPLPRHVGVGGQIGHWKFIWNLSFAYWDLVWDV